jgi:2-polyprenyl-6-methoxyphenol hydroxylase-like FAD-dependent oxidoreductase
MSPKTVDILIVGAGPTGLTLACELKRRGLNFRLIDKLSTPTTQSRALALQARSLDIFEKLGALSRMLDKGLAVTTTHLYENGQEIGKAYFTTLPTPYPFVLILPQSDTEAILAARLHELGGAIERSTELLSLEGSLATLLLPSGKQETIEATWIIGCDGAHSTVRHCLKLPFKGTKFPESFFLADVVIPNLAHREIHAFMTAKGILGIIPLPTSHHFRLITTFPTEQIDIPLSIERVIWSSLFSIHRRIVPHFSQGSTFLCGDAAHIHSPAGGQGLNIGIQDAFNLAWKLSAVLKKQSPPSLLSTYNEERHPVAQHTLWATTLATFFLSTPYPLLRRLLFRLLGKLLKWPPFRKRFSAALAETKTHYRFSSLSHSLWRHLFWPGPKPGNLAPFLSNDPEPRFILLVFGNPTYQPNHPWLAIRHLPLDHVLALAYHATKPCFYLIRPDGYIARRGRSFPTQFDIFITS